MNPREVTDLEPGEWCPDGNMVGHPEGGSIFRGNGTVIKATNPDTEWILIAPRTVLQNVAIWDAFGKHRPAMRGADNGPRFITYLENAHDVPMISTHWHGMTRYISGGVTGVDSPVEVIRSIGSWNGALYLEPHEKSFGLHVEPWDDTHGAFIQHHDRSWGLRVEAQEGAEPPMGSVSLTPRADVRSLHFQPFVPTTNAEAQFVWDQKVTGPGIAGYHAVSRYSGQVMHLNMGNEGGVFDGQFLDFSNAGQPVFQVTAAGDIVSRQIEALEARIAALEAAHKSQ